MKIRNCTKKGMSLMEMMVAIAIFTLGMAGFTTLFVQSWKSNSFIMEEGVAAAQASQTVNKVSKQLREVRQPETGEYMIKTANANELVVYVDDDNDGYVERVRYFLDDANDLLKKGVVEAAGSPLAYPADYSADAVTNIAIYVVNDASEPVFKYYNNINGEIAAPAMPTDIRVIEVNLWVNIKPLTAPENVRIGTSVELRNLDENI